MDYASQLTFEMIVRARQHVLVYDEQCLFCSLFKNVVRLLDLKGKICFIPMSGLSGSKFGMSAEDFHMSFHVVDPNGIIYSGGDAPRELIEVLSPRGVAAWIFQKIPQSSAWLHSLYSLLSGVKHSTKCGV